MLRIIFEMYSGVGMMNRNDIMNMNIHDLRLMNNVKFLWYKY